MPACQPPLNYRAMMCFFLRDEALTATERTVGLVMLLRASAKHKFKARPQALRWERIAVLAGLPAGACREAFDHLRALGWFELFTHEDGRESYRVPESRRAAAKEWNIAYWQKVPVEAHERAIA